MEEGHDNNAGVTAFVHTEGGPLELCIPLAPGGTIGDLRAIACEQWDITQPALYYLRSEDGKYWHPDCEVPDFEHFWMDAFKGNRKKPGYGHLPAGWYQSKPVVGKKTTSSAENTLYNYFKVQKRNPSTVLYEKLQEYTDGVATLDPRDSVLVTPITTSIGLTALGDVGDVMGKLSSFSPKASQIDFIPPNKYVMRFHYLQTMNL